MNPQRRPKIELYLHPPISPRQPGSDDLFYFPPIRERKSTPDSPAAHAPIQSSASDELSSDFPPIRERRSTPDPPPADPACPIAVHRHSSSQEPPHSQLRHPHKGLRHTNVVNTLHVATPPHRKLQKPPKLSQNMQKSSSKRDFNTRDVADDRPLKRKRILATSNDDMDWLKGEVADIKVCIREISEHLRGDVAAKLDELLDDVRHLS